MIPSEEYLWHGDAHEQRKICKAAALLQNRGRFDSREDIAGRAS